MSSDEFSGRVAMVTGGSHGLGRATAQALLDRGARVGVIDLDGAGAFAGRDDVHVLVGDIATEGLAARAIEETSARFGPVDILVNNAAAYPDASIIDMPLADWRHVFDVNVHGTFMACQAFARYCRTSGVRPASIVSISTGSARSPRPRGAAYAASKAAVEVLSAVLAMELGPSGIRSNVVAPGYIDVRGWSDVYPDRATDEMRKALTAHIPLGVAGSPTDIAATVLFLCSAAAEHVNGAVIPVDGGSSAGRLTLDPGQVPAGARGR